MALVICCVDDTDFILFLTSFKLAILFGYQVASIKYQDLFSHSINAFFKYQVVSIKYQVYIFLFTFYYSYSFRASS